PLLGRVSRLDVADLVDAELRAAGSVAPSSVRGEQEPDVVARVDAIEDRAGEPVASGEHRTPVGPRRPLDRLELVDVVTRLGAEEARQVLVAPPEHVHHQRCGGEGGPVRPIRLRQPNVEARRLDVAPGREGHEAPSRARPRLWSLPFPQSWRLASWA